MGIILDGLAAMDPTGDGLTAAQIVGRLTCPGKSEELAEVRAAVEGLCGKLDPVSLGCRFRHFRGRNFGGRLLDGINSGKHAARWRVCDAEGRPVRPDAPHPTAPTHHLQPPAAGDERGPGGGSPALDNVETPPTPAASETPPPPPAAGSPVGYDVWQAFNSLHDGGH